MPAGRKFRRGVTSDSSGAINDGGTIAGWGKNPSGQYRAFVLTPIRARVALRIEFDHGLIISWPTNVLGGVLFQNSYLKSNNWEVVTNVPTIIGDQYQVTISDVAVAQRFYRLQSQ